MSFRIAVDTGGTFTDVVVTTSRRRPVGEQSSDHATASTSTASPRRCATALPSRRLTLEGLLGATSVFIYGTTQATNAILTGSTARTAFLTTEGHPDTLVLREGGKLNPFDFRHAYPAPYVPRRLTFEVRERIDSEGQVAVALDEEAAGRDPRHVRELDVEAVAVCLLWSIVNPVHEERVGELVAEQLPGCRSRCRTAEPNHPRVPSRLLDRYRRVAEAADADVTSTRWRWICATPALPASCSSGPRSAAC